MIPSILKKLKIIQLKPNGDYEKKRINPYNPLSYIFLFSFYTIAIPFFFVYFGIRGIIQESGPDVTKPFTWR